jgi:tetratricopeptide (TPR) repeat protein
MSDRLRKMLIPAAVVAFVIVVVVFAVLKPQGPGGFRIDRVEVSTHGRIESLNDEDLAKTARPMPAQFGLDFELTRAGADKFNTRWETFTFFGGEALTPRMPEAVKSDLHGKKNLPVDELALLLDAYLMTGSGDAALSELARYIEANRKDEEALDFASTFAEKRLAPKLAVEYLYARFRALAGKIKSSKDKKEKLESAQMAKATIDRIDGLGAAYFLNRDTNALLRQLITLCPEQPAYLFDYVERLFEKKSYDKALSLLDLEGPKLAGRTKQYLALKARILEKLDRLDAAVAMYEKHELLFDSKLGLFSDLVSLLARNHRLESWRQDLSRRVQAGLDMPAMNRLFRYYAQNGDSELLAELLQAADDRARTEGISEEDLEALAELCALSRSSRVAAHESAYRWNLYLLSDEGEPRANAGANLAEALEHSDQPPPIPVAQAMGGGASVTMLDRYPGIAGGVLSLDLNLRGTQERFSAVPVAGDRYANLRIALALTEPLISADQPEPIATSAAKTAVSVVKRFGFYDQQVELIERILAAHPDSINADGFLWQLADYLAREKQLDREIDVYFRLIALADRKDDKKLASSARKRIVARYLAEKHFTDVIPFYWKQIRKNSDDETLLVEFLDFTKRNNLFEETVKAYELALKKFDRTSYGDRFAAYLLSKKARDDFRELTRSLSKTLNRNDLEKYLSRRVSSYGGFDSAENLFYEKMYRVGLERFPESKRLRDALLSFYDRFDHKSTEAKKRRTDLLLRYFATDPSLGPALCATLSQQKKLRAAVAELSAKERLNPVELRFLDAALGFLSRHESRRSVLVKLTEAYPEPELIGSLARLERSLDASFYVEDGGLTVSSANRYALLAELHPTRMEFATEAGEVLVEAGRSKSAAEVWERMLAVEPGRGNAYLELATIYWDYYLFPQAISVIDQARKSVDDPLLYAKEMAYIYESMDQPEAALDQYARLVCNEEWGDWEIENRLSTLSKRPGFPGKIDRSFSAYLDRAEAKPTEVLNYGAYLGRIDQREKKTSLYRKHLARFTEADFLTSVSDYFSGMGLTEDAEAALVKLADSSGRATDVLVRLLGFYESSDNKSGALSICAELLKANGPGSPRRQEILYRVAGTFHDNKKTEKALQAYKELVELAKGTQGDRRLFRYGEYALSIGNEKLGAKVLTELATRRPDNTQYLGALAAFYSKGERQADLVDLYTNAITNTRKADLTGRAKRDLIEKHRRRLIQALTAMGRTFEAVDQYIEILNRVAPDETIFDEVYRYAQAQEQLKRLLEYYEKLAEEAHKDYRWQLILGDIYDRGGDAERAALQYEKTIRNEPQRLVLYDRLAESRKRAGDLEGAFSALERRYELSGSVEDLRRMAEAAFAAGKRDRAVTLLLSVVEDEKTPRWRLFEVAHVFENNREVEQANRLLDRALKAFRADPVKEDLSSDQLDAIVRMTAADQGFPAAWNLLVEVRKELQGKSAKAGGMIEYRLKQQLATVEQALKHDLARRLFETGSPSERAAVSDQAKKQVDIEVTRSLVSSNRRQELDRRVAFFETLGKNAGLPELVLAAKQAKAEAYAYYASDKYNRHKYVAAVRNLVQELRRQGDPAGAVAALKTHDYSSWEAQAYDYHKRTARQAFFAGNKTTEAAALARLYDLGKQDSFNTDTPERLRHLERLLNLDRPALNALAEKTRRPGPFVLFTTHRKEKELALKALKTRFRKSVSWRLRREIQVLEYLGDAEGAKERYEPLLGLPRTIDSHQQGPYDEYAELTEGRWYEWAIRYGRLVSKSDPSESDAFLPAGVEEKPKNGSAYMALAENYADAGRKNEAIANIERAKFLTQNAPSIIALAGDLYLKMGDKPQAKKEYEKLIETGNEGLGLYRTYYSRMKKAGFADEARAVYVEQLAKAFPTLGYYPKREALAFLSEEIQEIDARIKTIRSLVESDPRKIETITQILHKGWIPMDRRSWFYLTAAETIGASDGYSISTKDQWWVKALNYAIDVRNMELGQRAIAAMRALSRDPVDNVEIDQRSAELALVCGDKGKALLALAEECEYRGCLIDLTNIASKHGKSDAVDSLRFLELTYALKKDQASTEDRLALAKLRFERKQPDGAKTLLEYVAGQLAQDADTLFRIAWIYLEAGIADQALTHLETAESVDPNQTNLKPAMSVAYAMMRQVEYTTLMLDRAFEAGGIGRGQMQPLFDKASKVLIANDAAKPFFAAARKGNEEGSKLFAAYLALAQRDHTTARDLLDSIPAPRFYETFREELLAEAHAGLKNPGGAAESLARALAKAPYRKDLRAERFLTMVKLGRHETALAEIEDLFPTDRYALLDPLSTSTSVSSAAGFPGQFGLAGQKGDMLIFAAAKALKALDYPAEAATYYKALFRRNSSREDAAEVKRNIVEMEKRIEKAEAKLRPLPVITNEQ